MRILPGLQAGSSDLQVSAEAFGKSLVILWCQAVGARTSELLQTRWEAVGLPGADLGPHSPSL